MKVIDFHSDTFSTMRWLRSRGKETSFLSNDLHIDLQRMIRGDYLLQTFAIFTDAKAEQDQHAASMEILADFFMEMERNSDRIRQVKTWYDLENNMREGKLSALLSIEDGEITVGAEDLLRTYRQAGVRLMTLTWNYENHLGWPNDPDSADCPGLTRKGIDTLEEMEELGIIPDVSHLSDAGIFRLADVTKKPFMASHSNARQICGHPRNLTDPMIRLIGERGGIIGLNFFPSFLREGYQPGSAPVTMKEMAAHIEHITNTGGSEIIALGSDFDGISDAPEGLSGCQDMPHLADYLTSSGFSTGSVEKLFHENALRFLRENL